MIYHFLNSVADDVTEVSTVSGSGSVHLINPTYVSSTQVQLDHHQQQKECPTAADYETARKSVDIDGQLYTNAENVYDSVPHLDN